MKSTKNEWNSPNTDATNCSGFTGLPGGWRVESSPSAQFHQLGDLGMWWTSTARDFDGEGSAWRRDLARNYGGVIRNDRILGQGLAIRCLRD